MKRLIVACVVACATSFAALAEDEAGKFDFYVLALSWAPSYCAEEGRNDTSGQCDVDGPKGFIVHGLWPQYERGYPQDCFGDTWLADEVIATNSDLFPSRRLMIHEWRKHGVCSGLSQKAYFTKIRSALAAIKVPDLQLDGFKSNRTSPKAIEKAFGVANDELDANEMAVTCSRRNLRDVRICLTKELEPRGCPEVDERACTRSEVVLPGVNR